MARAVGLDIGSHAVKVVELSGGAKSFRIQRVAIRPIPTADELAIAPTTDEDEEELGTPRERAIVEILRDTFKTLALPKEDTCASFPSRETVFRELTVPFTEADQIRKVVKYEAENHLHSHSVDDVIVNWVKTGETKGGSRLTIFASPKMDLAQHIALMRRAGVDPAAVDLDVTAVFTCLDAAGIFERYPNAVVLDVGAATSNLLMVVNGQPRVMRSFRLGVGDLERTVGQDLDVPAPDARHAVAAHHGPRKDDLFAPAEPLDGDVPETEMTARELTTAVVRDGRGSFVAKLHREVLRTLSAVRTEHPPETVLLVGGGSLIPTVADDLSTRFGLPVEPIDLLQFVDCKDPGGDPQYVGAAIAPAVGSALRLLGRDPLNIELLREEFAPRNTFDVLKTALATLLTLGFVLLGIQTLKTKQELAAARVEYADRAQVVRHMTRQAEIKYLRGVEAEDRVVAEKKTDRWLKSLGNSPERILRMRSRLRQRHIKLAGDLGLAKNIPRLPSATKVMVEVYKALSAEPRDTFGYFKILKMKITESILNFDIVLDTLEDAERAAMLLRKNAYLRSRAADPTDFVGVRGFSKHEGRHKQSFEIKFRKED